MILKGQGHALLTKITVSGQLRNVMDLLVRVYFCAVQYVIVVDVMADSDTQSDPASHIVVLSCPAQYLDTLARVSDPLCDA